MRTPFQNVFSAQLIRSWAFPLSAWTLVAGISLTLQILDANRSVETVARIQGNDVFRIIEATRLWNAKHGGVLVAQDIWTPPNPYLELPERDPITQSGRQLTTMNPAYMTRQLAAVIEQEVGIQIHLTSLKPINPANGPDAWERSALESFKREGIKEQSDYIERNGSVYSRYMAPLVAKKSCLNCHCKQGYEEGDIRGGISVTQNVTPLLDAMRSQVMAHVIIHLIVWLLAVVAILAFAAYRHAKQKELQRSQALLARNERMASLGSLVAGVAHEVSTPLGVSVTAASMLADAQENIHKQIQQETLSQDYLEERLRTIAKASSILTGNLERTARLIRSFKQLAVDQDDAEIRDFKVAKLLDEIVTAHHNQLQKIPVEVQVDCPALLIIHKAAEAFTQIITNLLQNALIHAFKPGREAKIEITARDLGDSVEIVFADNGVGIEPTMARRVFDPFVTNRLNQGGSGLGLNIVYNLVTQRFAGDIRLDSSPGLGTAFTIELAKD